MPTIALDATYTVDHQPSGVALYSRRLIESLAALETSHRFLLCYRLSRFRRRRDFLRPVNPMGSREPRFRIKSYQGFFTFWLPWQAELFHSLAQRPPAFHFKREIVTVLDIFPITGRDYSTPEFQRKFSALLFEALERATRIITPSRYTAEQLLALSPVLGDKIRVIPLGIDPPGATLAPEQRALERERLVGRGNEMILSVGAIQTRKNTLNSLRALERLPGNYRLVLAGGSGHGSEAVYEFIHNEHLESRVSVLGYVPADRLPILYDAASVLLYPSLEEGFGFPVLEGMAHGIPVVASRTSSLPEVGGDAALYVNPREPGDIAEKVERAVEDQTLREKMIHAGRARVREFTWRRTAESTLTVYDEVLRM